jgi:hypothetical protein
MLTRSRLLWVGGNLVAALCLTATPSLTANAKGPAPAKAPAKAADKAPAKAPDKAPAKGAAGKPTNEAKSRSIQELAGKFKWGSSPDEVKAVIAGEIEAKYKPRIQAEPDASKQDAIRREMREEIDRMGSSYVKFSGQKLGWDVSLVDREYGHRNNESMLVMWEPNQRRFLFFWHDKLYKQYIAYNAERFAGKTFDEFAEGMQVRYGKAEMSFAKKQTEDEMALDYLQWPPAGEIVLRAYDQSHFYGNFCLALLHKGTYEQVEKERAVNSPPRVRRTNVHVVDQISETGGAGDPNANVIDEVVGRKAQPSVEQKRIQERIMKEYQANQPPKKP